MEHGKDKGPEDRINVPESKSTRGTCIGFCSPSEGEKVGQQRTVTSNRGSDREPPAEPCQDEAVRHMPFTFRDWSEVTWPWGKLGL